MYKYKNKYIRVIPDLHNEKPTKPTATQSERILLLHSSTYHMPALHARPSLPMLLIYNSGQVHTYDRHRPCIRHLNLISQILLPIQVEAICWVYVCVWVDYVKWKIILIFWFNFRGNGQTLTLFPPQRRTTKIRAQRLKGKHSSRPSQFQVKYVGVCVTMHWYYPRLNDSHSSAWLKLSKSHVAQTNTRDIPQNSPRPPLLYHSSPRCCCWFYMYTMNYFRGIYFVKFSSTFTDRWLCRGLDGWV